MLRFFILFIFLNSFVFGQRSSKKNIESYPSFDLIYGQKFLSHKTFGGELNSIQNLKLFKSIMYAGIGMTGNFVTNRDYNFDGHFHYAQIVPQLIKINDSLNANLTGFNIACSVTGFDIFRKLNRIDLFLSAGFNVGRLRLYGNALVRQKNPYFSPKISLTPRFILGKICLQLNMDYEIDVSRKTWRRTFFSDSPKINLTKTSMTGFAAFLSLGYAFGTK